MPRVLVLARHFPPIGGAGVHRTLGTITHLPAHGYEPIVVTGTPLHRDRWEPRDEALLARVPDDVAVHRVASEQAGTSSKVDRVLGRPPAWARTWVERSVALGAESGRAAGVEVVYASCVPYETAYAGARVARALGVPWVADLEDPWALDEMRLHPSALHHARDLRRMRRALASAAAVVMCAPEAAARVRARIPEVAGRPVAGIPIGFERAAADGAADRPDDGVLRIVHTGSMHTDLGEHLRASARRRALLGGTTKGLDVLPRSHVHLVAAIARLLAESPELEGRIELVLAGGLTDADRAVVAGHAFVRDAGLLSHADTVALMRSADLLFLPMHDLPGRAGLIPYKTFEYLAAERPILAAVPDGDVRDLLGDLAHVTLTRPADVDAMVAALRAALARGPVATVADGVDSPALAQLDRRVSVARIAEVLDAVLGRGRASAEPVPAIAAERSAVA